MERHPPPPPPQGNKLPNGHCMRRAISITKLFKTRGAMVNTPGFLWITTSTTKIIDI